MDTPVTEDVAAVAAEMNWQRAGRRGHIGPAVRDVAAGMRVPEMPATGRLRIPGRGGGTGPEILGGGLVVGIEDDDTRNGPSDDAEVHGHVVGEPLSEFVIGRLAVLQRLPEDGGHFGPVRNLQDAEAEVTQ